MRRRKICGKWTRKGEGENYEEGRERWMNRGGGVSRRKGRKMPKLRKRVNRDISPGLRLWQGM